MLVPGSWRVWVEEDEEAAGRAVARAKGLAAPRGGSMEMVGSAEWRGGLRRWVRPPAERSQRRLDGRRRQSRHDW